MNAWLDENLEPMLVLTYIIGVPLSFGILLPKFSELAVLMSLVWPATGLAYLGYWLTS